MNSNGDGSNMSKDSSERHADAEMAETVEKTPDRPMAISVPCEKGAWSCRTADADTGMTGGHGVADSTLSAAALFKKIMDGEISGPSPEAVTICHGTDICKESLSLAYSRSQIQKGAGADPRNYDSIIVGIENEMTESERRKRTQTGGEEKPISPSPTVSRPKFVPVAKNPWPLTVDSETGQQFTEKVGNVLTHAVEISSETETERVEKEQKCPNDNKNVHRLKMKSNLSAWSSISKDVNQNSEDAKFTRPPVSSVQSAFPNMSVLLNPSTANMNADRTAETNESRSHMIKIVPIITSTSNDAPTSALQRIPNQVGPSVNLLFPMYKLPRTMSSTPASESSDECPKSAKVPKLELPKCYGRSNPSCQGGVTTNDSPQQIYVQRSGPTTRSPSLSSSSDTSSSSGSSDSSPMDISYPLPIPKEPVQYPHFSDLQQFENEHGDMSEPVALLKLSDAILQGSTSPQIAKVAESLKITSARGADTQHEQEAIKKPTIQLHSSPVQVPQAPQTMNSSFASCLAKQAPDSRTGMAPTRGIPTALNPQSSIPVAPKTVHFISMLNTPKNATEKGPIVLPVKGTPHPTQGIYMPQAPRGQVKYSSILQTQTPTGLVIRSSLPRQRFDLNTGVSPHASPANLTLNSSGEENSGTSPEDTTPPPRVPFNTPLSGLPRFPVLSRMLNNSTFLARIENAKEQRPNPEENSDCSPPLPVLRSVPVRLVQQAVPIPENVNYPYEKDQHNAKERRRRARIKVASDRLRNIVPGLSAKTDKATALEFAVEYILFMKQHMNTHSLDKEFLDRCNPY